MRKRTAYALFERALLLRLYHDQPLENALDRRHQQPAWPRVAAQGGRRLGLLRTLQKLTAWCTSNAFQYVGNAIAREKQIKGLLRIKNIALIVSQNSAWRDLSEGWYDACPIQRSA